MSGLTTHHAPAERNPDELVKEESRLVKEQDFLKEVFYAMPEVAVVLNDKRQIVYANEGLLSILPSKDYEDIVGTRLGEAIDCIHSNENEGGCGTSEACRFCGAVNAVLRSMKANDKVELECRIVSFIEEEEYSFDYRVTATPLRIKGQVFTMVIMTDISSEKRKMAL